MSLKLLSCHFITFIGIEMLFHSAIVTNYLSVIRQRKRRKKKKQNSQAQMKHPLRFEPNNPSSRVLPRYNLRY